MIVLAAFVVLLAFARDTTFRYDDWDFVANRALGDLPSLLRPYNDEWITVPAIVYRLVFGWFGLSSYLPYLAVTVAAHLLSADRLRALITAVAGPRSGLAFGVVFLFLGTAGEVLNQAIGFGVVFPVALGIWAMDQVLVRNHAVRGAGLLLVASACHPIGMVFLAAITLVSVGSNRVLAALLGTWIFVAWWALVFEVGAAAGRSGSLPGGLAAIPAFVVVGLLAAFSAVVGLSLPAGVGVALAVGAAAMRRHRGPAHARVFSAAVLGLLGEFALIGLLRWEYGVGIAAASRYLEAAAAFLLIALAAWFGPALERTITRDRRSGAFATGVVVALVVVNLGWYAAYRSDAARAVHETRAAVAILGRQPGLESWGLDLYLPQPSRLRDLIRRYGTPTRDALMPAVVPKVPPAIAAEMCTITVPSEPIPTCVAWIDADVGQGD